MSDELVFISAHFISSFCLLMIIFIMSRNLQRLYNDQAYKRNELERAYSNLEILLSEPDGEYGKRLKAYYDATGMVDIVIFSSANMKSRPKGSVPLDTMVPEAPPLKKVDILKKQPKDLDEAVELIMLDFDNWNERTRQSVRRGPEHDFLGIADNTLGLSLRNHWLLWWQEEYPDEWPTEKPAIVAWFNEKQIYHADDMSGIILTTVYRKVNHLTVDLDGQIAKKHEHWLKTVGSINPNQKSNE